MLQMRQRKPKMAPAIVTALQPYLFTKELEIGPEIKEAVRIVSHLKNLCHSAFCSGQVEKLYLLYFWRKGS